MTYFAEITGPKGLLFRYEIDILDRVSFRLPGTDRIEEATFAEILEGWGHYAITRKGAERKARRIVRRRNRSAPVREFHDVPCSGTNIVLPQPKAQP